MATIIFLVMRTFKIYSLSNVPMCRITLLTTVAIRYVAGPGLTCFVMESGAFGLVYRNMSVFEELQVRT